MKKKVGKVCQYGIFEVFYTKKGKVEGYTQDPECGWYDSPTELIKSLELMLKDAKKYSKKVLTYKD